VRWFDENRMVKVEKKTVNGRKKNANPTELLLYRNGTVIDRIEEPMQKNEVDIWLKSHGLIKKDANLKHVA
jgi:hypothetical protein